MIDLRQLRDNPDRFREGCRRKGVAVEIDRLLELDARKRDLQTRVQELKAEQNRIAKESGPQIGRLQGLLRAAQGDERDRLAAEIEALKLRPTQMKAEIAAMDAQLAQLEPEVLNLLLQVPMPPDDDVPVGASSEDNIEIARWCPPGFDLQRGFAACRGFAPKTHIEIVRDLGLADFDRGVKLGGARHYVLTGDGARLHHAVLRYALDFMADRHGFTPLTVPVVVREEMMVGTGFFPAGREQAYHIAETSRGGGHDFYLTGTGEVSLMGLHQDEILDEASLPLRYVTVSTCFRREAGAAGKDTAGLYRIHQFDKVEQVVICRADEQESRDWHRKMIGFVRELLESLSLPYRLLQCCTGDLGVKNADMVDIECWMPGRGDTGPDGRPSGAFGETHSASRLYDFQCRRLNMRYRSGGDKGTGPTTFCHSLNNTVIASPRILIPLLEMHQQPDGHVAVPEPLRAYMGGRARIG
ncbi:MAG: serine--tRNA ligase [Phycisphaeraceae bacterium]|nr:serine--tRNA ligase [Phycisphaeraceae bacterium]MCW5753317.1 serine--tRNA ligase [Phycisphaeraceae bacterium]